MTMRVGVVGYGLGGRVFHVPFLQQAGLEVSHVVTRDPGRAAEARRDVPGVQVLASLEELLGRTDRPDLVVLASPTGLHAEQAHAVVEAGVPLVVDKPLATTEAGARAVVEHAERWGVPLTVHHNRRWDTEQRTLRALLAAGELGQVYRFERRWERWRPVPKDRWKENDPTAGGLLLDLGSHLVDSAVELFGPVRRVYAELRSLTAAADDDVFLALTHEGGVVSHLQAGGVVAAPGPRSRVLGSRGAFLVTSFEGEPTPFGTLDEGVEGHGGWLVRGAERTPVPAASGEHADFYRAVAAWLRGETPVPVDPWDAVRTARVLDAARVSAREGRVVTLG